MNMPYEMHQIADDAEIIAIIHALAAQLKFHGSGGIARDLLNERQVCLFGPDEQITMVGYLEPIMKACRQMWPQEMQDKYPESWPQLVALPRV